MFKQNTIKLDSREVPAPDPRLRGFFTALPGKVIVQLLPPRESMSGFQLPDMIGAKYRANVGVVLGAGGKRNESEENTRADRWLEFGDGVVCRPYDGEWFDDLTLGEFSFDSRVVFFGVHGQPPLEDVLALAAKKTPQGGDGEVWSVPWWESVVAKFVGRDLYPTGDNVLIRRHKRFYAVLSPDLRDDWQEEVEIVRAGPFKEIRPGMAVVKCPAIDILDIEFSDETGLAIVPASAVHAYA